MNYRDEKTDLCVSISLSKEETSIGKAVLLIIKVINYGPEEATQVVLNYGITDKVILSEITLSQGSYYKYDRQLICKLGTIPNGNTVMISVTITPKILGEITNKVFICGREYDPNLENNISCKNLNVVSESSADISVKMVVSPKLGILGGNVTYYVIIDNNGPSKSSDVSLTVTLPSNVIFESATSDEGILIRKESKVICKYRALDVGSTDVIKITVRPQLSGYLKSTARVNNPQQYDPNPYNNKISIGSIIVPPYITLNGSIWNNQEISATIILKATFTVSGLLGNFYGRISQIKNGKLFKYEINSDQLDHMVIRRKGSMRVVEAVFSHVTVAEKVTGIINSDCISEIRAVISKTGNWQGYYTIRFPDGKKLKIFGLHKGSLGFRDFCYKKSFVGSQNKAEFKSNESFKNGGKLKDKEKKNDQQLAYKQIVVKTKLTNLPGKFKLSHITNVRLNPKITKVVKEDKNFVFYGSLLIDLEYVTRIPVNGQKAHSVSLLVPFADFIEYSPSFADLDVKITKEMQELEIEGNDIRVLVVLRAFGVKNIENLVQ